MSSPSLSSLSKPFSIQNGTQFRLQKEEREAEGERGIVGRQTRTSAEFTCETTAAAPRRGMEWSVPKPIAPFSLQERRSQSDIIFEIISKSPIQDHLLNILPCSFSLICSSLELAYPVIVLSWHLTVQISQQHWKIPHQEKQINYAIMQGIQN